jgi:orotidine-5'-phosphate decarboxylase
VTTVPEAVRMGAGLIVLGRAVTAAPDPAAALAAARAEAREAAATARP